MLQAPFSAVGEPVKLARCGSWEPSTPGWRSSVNNNFKAADRQNSQQSFPLPGWRADASPEHSARPLLSILLRETAASPARA